MEEWFDVFSSMVGPLTDKPAGVKGRIIRNIMPELNMFAANTFADGHDGAWTCHYFLKAEPKQIDYVWGSMDLTRRLTCSPRDIDATPTDHRAMVWEIQGDEVGGKDMRSRRKRAGRKKKPIGWKLEDLGYAMAVKDVLGLDGPVVYSEAASVDFMNVSFHIFTDGHCYV